MRPPTLELFVPLNQWGEPLGSGIRWRDEEYLHSYRSRLTVFVNGMEHCVQISHSDWELHDIPEFRDYVRDSLETKLVHYLKDRLLKNMEVIDGRYNTTRSR